MTLIDADAERLLDPLPEIEVDDDAVRVEDASPETEAEVEGKPDILIVGE